ncbi:hypothetical protein EV715DRAFT_254812 [Schizophyllum commune]
MAPKHDTSPCSSSSVQKKPKRRNRVILSCLNCHASRRMCDRERPTCGRCAQLGLAALCMYQTPDPRGMPQPPPPPAPQVVEQECAPVEPPLPVHEPMGTSPTASTSCQSPQAPMTPPTLPPSAPMTPPVPSRAPSPPVYPACMLRKQESPVPLPPVPPQCELPPTDDLYAHNQYNALPPTTQTTYPMPPMPNGWPPMPLISFEQACLMASAFPYLPWWNAMLALASCPPVPPPAPPTQEQHSAPSLPPWDMPAPVGYGGQQPGFEQFMANVTNCPTAWGVPPVPPMPPVPQPEAPLANETCGAASLPSDDFSQLLLDSMLVENMPCSMDPMTWESSPESSSSDASLSPLCSSSSSLDTSCPSLCTPGASPGLESFESDNFFGMPAPDPSGLPDMNIDFSAWDLSLPCDDEQQQIDAQGMFQPFLPRPDNWLSPEFA